MPLIQVFSSVPVPSDRIAALLGALSTTLASHLGKPESYVMTRLAPVAPMTFGGSDAPTCYAEVKNVGSMTPEQTQKLSRAISSELEKLGVPKNRIYIEFCYAKPHLWGYDGDTFG